MASEPLSWLLRNGGPGGPGHVGRRLVQQPQPGVGGPVGSSRRCRALSAWAGRLFFVL